MNKVSQQGTLLCTITVALVTISCSKPDPVTATRDKEATLSTQATETIVSTTSRPSVVPSVNSSSSTNIAKNVALQSRCKEDTDCHFQRNSDDAACISVKATLDNSVPMDNAQKPTCVCREGHCVQKPRSPLNTSEKCSKNTDCKLDAPRAQCKASPSYTRPIWTDGPYCACESSFCTYVFHERVPCSTFADCSYSTNPLRPVSSKEVPRRTAKPVKPCNDGERDSICKTFPDGKFCSIVAWSC